MNNSVNHSVPFPSRPIEIDARTPRRSLHTNAPLVVKVGGALLEDAQAHIDSFAGLIALHRAHPGGIILVHGGGAQVDRQLKLV